MSQNFLILIVQYVSKDNLGQTKDEHRRCGVFKLSSRNLPNYSKDSFTLSIEHEGMACVHLRQKCTGPATQRLRLFTNWCATILKSSSEFNSVVS